MWATDHRRGSWLAAVPPAVLIVLLYRWGVDVPYWDQWLVAPLVDDLFSGRLALADVWSQHNDHRVFFPRLLMLALAWPSRWNVRWEMAANVVLAAVLFALVVRMLPRGRRLLAAPAVSLLVFNLNQWENWCWGLQLVVFVNAAAVAGGLALLAAGAGKARNLAGAAALGTVASYSFSNGLLFWPLALPLVLLPHRGRWPRALAWLAVAAAVVAVYFAGYHFAEHSLAPRSLGDLARFGAYVGVFVGAPVFSYDGKLAGLGGVLALAAFAVLAARLGRRRETWPWILLAGYGAGSGVVAAAGRLELGLELAMSSRYVSFANFFWLGLLGLVVRWLEEAEPSARARAWLRGAMAAAVLSLVASGVWGGVLLNEQHRDRSAARRALAAGTLGENQPLLYPGNEIPPQHVEALRRHRLSLFRQDD